jgi:hypothetical protein
MTSVKAPRPAGDADATLRRKHEWIETHPVFALGRLDVGLRDASLDEHRDGAKPFVAVIS